MRPSAAFAFVATLVASCVASGVASRDARADAASATATLDACLRASDEGQVLRDQTKYVRARDAFLACSQTRCPSIVRGNCARWLQEVEAGLPTVVLSAVDAHSDTSIADASVTIDGATSMPRLTGVPMAIDPGSHVFSFRHGGEAVDVEMLVSVGEKNRPVVARFAGRSHEPAARPETPPADVPRGARGVALPFALSSIGVVGIGVFSVLGLTASADLRALEDAPCASSRTCHPDEESSIRTRFLVADVALFAGLVALGAGVWLWLDRPSAGARTRLSE